MSLANWSVILQLGSKFARRFFRSHDRVDFEIDDITPVGDPFIQKLTVLSFHQLPATIQRFVHPTRNTR